MKTDFSGSGARRSLDSIKFLLIIVLAFWMMQLDAETSWQRAGSVNFSLGLVMLAGYASARAFQKIRLPLITGYIFTGIVAGPHVSGFLTRPMIADMGLINDLALSYIALTAGGSLHLRFLRQQGRIILSNIVFSTLMVALLVFVFILFLGEHFTFIQQFSRSQTAAMALLLGIICVARSPSSAIAIIGECRAGGVFTETVLGVTVAIDVLIIILFTLGLALAKVLFAPEGGTALPSLSGIFFEIAFSIGIGAAAGKGIAVYIRRVGHDLTAFLLCFAFGVAKLSEWLGAYMLDQFALTLHLEPLLICMSAGFAVQNGRAGGAEFMASLEHVSLPIYVLFFSLAGAALRLDAVAATWSLSLSLALLRAVGIFTGAYLAGTLCGEPPRRRRIAGMAYLTQAGVAIGLSQLAQEQFPEMGLYLNTVVLALITINQVVGPVTFKTALKMAGESRAG